MKDFENFLTRYGMHLGVMAAFIIVCSCVFSAYLLVNIFQASISQPVPTLVFPTIESDDATSTPTPAAFDTTPIPTAPDAPPTPAPASAVPTGKIAFTCQVYKLSARNQICVINPDGTGEKRLTTADEANHSYPSFDPAGEFVYFSSNMDGGYDIYRTDLDSNIEPIVRAESDLYAPAVSPDNTTIMFTADDGDNQTIWLADIDGANQRPLVTGVADAWDPVWSPAGDAVLFASDHDGSIQLYVVGLDGRERRQVTEFDNLRGRNDWSPDGRWMATYQGESWMREIILFDTNGDNRVQLTNGGNNLAPSFSPDGAWVAFTSYLPNYREIHGCEIYIMRVDGSELTRLTVNDYCDWQPRWGK